MNLIYLHQYFKFPDETGGTRSYDLATSFLKRGLNVTVVSATSNKKYNNSKRWNIIEKDGLTIHYIYLPYGNHLSYLKRSIVFFHFLWYSTFKLLKLKSDIVLATSTPLTIGIPALFKKWFHKTPFVFEVRDVWPEAVIAIGAIRNKGLQYLLYRLEKIVYSNASYIVPLSTDMQHSIVTRYPQYKEKAKVVIENIAELKRFENSALAPKDLSEFIPFTPRFSILYAGTFGRVNGIDYVINLAEKTLPIDSLLVYILLGNGAEKEKIKELALERNVLNKNVFILESVTKEELPAWYKAVDMGSSFVIDIKELWANSANKFFDTLAASKPILINHEGWQAERIREDNIGYVLQVSLTDQAVEEFVEYTQNEKLYSNQAQNALLKAKELYSLDVAAEKYLNLFNNIKDV